MLPREQVVARLQGPLVPVLAAFDDKERLDLDSVSRWIDSLIERGIRLFWTTSGTSHYWCLSDAEVRELNSAVAARTRGRAMFIASTAFHWSVQQCVEFIHHVAERGADAVKVQIDWKWWSPRDDQVLAHYQRIAAAAKLPLLAYTAGQPGIKPELLVRILQIPEFVGIKNDTGDFYEQTAYLRAIRSAGVPFAAITGGTMEAFLHGWQFGARAFAVGTAIYAPQVAIEFHRHLQANRLAEAAALVRRCEQPVLEQFVPMGHWACFHAALHLQGHFEWPTLRFPQSTPSAEQTERVQAILAAQGWIRA